MSCLTSGRIVRVDLPDPARSYDIVVGEGVISEAGTLLRLRLGQRKCVIVTDSNVAPLYLHLLEAVIAAAGHTLHQSITVPAGEGSKDFSVLQTVINKMLAGGLDRGTLVIALGGGVIGDLAGFSASIAMRGVDVVQIPTTLLAQVDSSVGGKTGINTPYGKNTVGTFHQPRLVLSDVSTLDSLSRRETLSGYAEIVKYGLINDPDFFQWCVNNGDKLLRGDRESQVHAVSYSCKNKAMIVASDEKESGNRALLNLGHTFGHALETVTGYSDELLHGEAVAIGMVMAFGLSAHLGLCSDDDAKMVREHFAGVDLPISPPKSQDREYDVPNLIKLMLQDKKNRDGKMTLILAKGIGKAFISHDVDAESVREYWRKALA